MNQEQDTMNPIHNDMDTDKEYQEQSSGVERDATTVLVEPQTPAPKSKPKKAGKKMWSSTGQKDCSVLSSTHLVFFKIYDYLDLDGNIPRNQRFLSIFTSAESFFDVALAVAVLICQLVIIFNIYHETTQLCASRAPGRGMWMGALLCSLYAASVATEAFLLALPYEVHGMTPQKAEDVIRQIETAKGKKIDTDDVEKGVNGAETDSENEPLVGSTVHEGILSYTSLTFVAETMSYKTVQRAVSAFYLYSVTAMLQISNILLLLVAAFIMGSSDTFTDLVSKFISVEIVIHVHEIVPRVLMMRDKSPQSFNKSGITLEQELELQGRLPYGQIIPAGANGKNGVFRHSAKYHKNIIFWSFFFFVYISFLSINTVCRLLDF